MTSNKGTPPAIPSANIDTQLLERRLEDLSHPRVLIVGDIILDRYVTGDVARISPEAPIPVLSARSSEMRLGGAGNVAANLRAMGAEVEIIAMVGDDALANTLGDLLGEFGVAASGLYRDPTRPTIQKSRMMSGGQQMLRVDWEDPRPIDQVGFDWISERLDAAVAASQAVVLSDYGKGLLTPPMLRRVIDCARAANIPVLVDPKGIDYSIYSGATLITPNKKEAETALGRRIGDMLELPGAAKELIEAAELDAVVITLGAEGIYYLVSEGVGDQLGAVTEGRIPTQARAVYDVTGAGDTVVAHLALYLAAGLDLQNALALANHAAGIVVGRLGTNSVTRAELATRLGEEMASTGKVLDEASLDAVIEEWRREGKRVVFTNGCFDVLHAGHVDYLRYSRSKGDVLIVGVNDDASVRSLKGETRPVNPLPDRLCVLSALEMVDAVVPFGEDTPARIIERVTPDVLVKGEDWKDRGVVGREWVEKHGGQVVLAPLLPGRSTTSILERGRASADAETKEA